MKKNNIKQLKKWMVNRSTDSIRCRIYGVQAYGISKHEYNVIVEFAKQGGRYYFTLCALFLIQGTAQTAKTAGRYARIAWRWLNTRHLFGDDSEAVTLTGWQYLGVAAVAIACGLLFSIKF